MPNNAIKCKKILVEVFKREDRHSHQMEIKMAQEIWNISWKRSSSRLCSFIGDARMISISPFSQVPPSLFSELMLRNCKWTLSTLRASLTSSSFPVLHKSNHWIGYSPVNSVGFYILACPLRLREKKSFFTLEALLLKNPYLTNPQPYARIIIYIYIYKGAVSGARNCHSMSYKSKH